MIRDTRGLLAAVFIVGLVVLAACSSSADDQDGTSVKSGFAIGDAATESAPVEKEVIREVVVERVVAEREVTKEVALDRGVAEKALPAPGAPGAVSGPEVAFYEEQVAALVTQRRIIVRTVDMRIVVADIAASIDLTSELAQELGGWVVSTNRSEKHRGFVSIRVPAERLDEAILRLRQGAVDVESEVSTSRDITDEYVDIQSRLTNLTATEGALLGLLRRADKIEDALKVQEALTTVQGDIERLQGRIKFLEQTSAFSLLNLTLVLEPAEMTPDAGPDQTAGVGEIVRFRASFEPPEDIDDFTYTWDFGDGTPVIRSSRTAPTEDEDQRVTATVTHVYSDERDSPYIAQLEISGFGEAGIAEGEVTLIVTVTRVPTIEVFAGERIVVEEGEPVEFEGTFTRPEGVKNLRYRWTFGDGSTPAEGDLADGVTSAVATHVFPNHRPLPFTATLTITAESDAGTVEGKSSVRVQVMESEGWVIAGWSVGGQIKIAVRSASAIGLFAVSALIWAAIFSPVLALVAIATVVLRRRWRVRASRKAQEETSSENDSVVDGA